MTGPVKPISPVAKPRSVRRRLQLFLARERMEEHAASPEREVVREVPARPDGPPTEAGVAAQLMGERERRGLRAGYEVREQARATYLQTEYAGPHDRRPRKGRITKTEV
ncbi:MAG TPA: hypothetical protein VF699_03415 [Caulobacteraceae bacterium]|jgi:hypothetical protein